MPSRPRNRDQLRGLGVDLGVAVDVAPGVEAPRVPRLQRQAQVLVDRQALEQVGDLERAREALLADAVRRQAAGSPRRAGAPCPRPGANMPDDDVEQRGLARAVRADQRVDLAGVALRDSHRRPRGCRRSASAPPSTSSTVPWRAVGTQERRQRQALVDLARAHRRGFLGRRPPAPLQLRPDADQPARRVQHEADEHQPEPEQPVAGPHREQLAEQDVEQRPQRRAEDVVHAADHHHRQQLAGEGHRDRLRRNEVVLEAEQRAGEPGHHRREDERRQLVPLDGVALERGALLVLADRHEHVAERRAHHAQQARTARRAPIRATTDVVDERVVEGDRPDAAALQAAEPVLAAGDLGPAEGDGVGERRERERQQREVHAAPAQDEDADDGGEHGDEHHREQDRDRDLVVRTSASGRARRHRRRCRTRRCGRRT